MADRKVERGTEAAPDDESGCELIEGPWPDKADAWRAQVPGGLYQLSYVSSKLVKRYRRSVWDILFEIVSGPAGGLKGEDGQPLGPDAFAGQRLLYYLTKPEPSDRPSLRSKLATDYRLIAERLPPRHLHRIRPQDLYGETLLEAIVRGREKSDRGDTLPEGARVSSVARITGRLAGCPPLLKRQRPRAK